MIPCPCTKSKVFCTFCETLTKNTGCFCAECGSHIPYRLIGGGNGSDSGFQRGHHVLFISNKAAGEHRHFGGSAHPAQDLGHGAGQQVQTVRQIWRNLIQAFQCDGIQQEYPQNGGQPKLLGTADEGLPGGDDAVGLGGAAGRFFAITGALPASAAPYRCRLPCRGTGCCRQSAPWGGADRRCSPPWRCLQPGTYSRWAPRG